MPDQTTELLQSIRMLEAALSRIDASVASRQGTDVLGTDTLGALTFEIQLMRGELERLRRMFRVAVASELRPDSN